MVKANFTTYGSCVTDSIYQWEIDRVLQVTGLNLTMKPEVHFSNAALGLAVPRQADLVDGVVKVGIPNSLLQYPLPIYAHVGIYDGSTFKVIQAVEIPVKRRARPADYQIEDRDEELYSFNRLENMLNNINDEWIAANAEHVQATVSSWLDAHPEATTTVQDKSLTLDKFVVGALGYVTPEMYGAKGDGVTDDTAALQAALAAADHVLLNGGVYLISDTLNVSSGTVVEMRNAKIKSTATANKKYIFSLSGVSDVKLYGENATLEMSKPETAQQACINIANAKRVLVKGFTLTQAGGDGVIIGGTNTNEAADVEVADCIVDGNRRNGISIVGGVDGIRVHDCVIKNTGGASPQLGIDIETWDSAYLNKNIDVYRNRFEGNVNGDLTIFEYSSGVHVQDNHFTGVVSVKTNAEYNGNVAANPTDLSFHGNVFEKDLYFYGIIYGGFSVAHNTFNGSAVQVESPVAVTSDSIGEIKSKQISGNMFNGAGVAISCGYNAHMLVSDNVVTDCAVFFNAWGLFDSVVKGNVITGYNTGGASSAVFNFNGQVERVTVEHNRVIANAKTKSVAQLLYFRGGAAAGNIIRFNDFTAAKFTDVITYGSQGDNLDHANATPACSNYCRGLPTASRKFAGMFLTITGNTSMSVYFCTLVNGSYTWRDVTAKL